MEEGMFTIKNWIVFLLAYLLTLSTLFFLSCLYDIVVFVSPHFWALMGILSQRQPPPPYRSRMKTAEPVGRQQNGKQCDGFCTTQTLKKPTRNYQHSANKTPEYN